MSVHTYTRALVNGAWDVDNQDRIDGDGNRIMLATEIKAALPGEPFVERSDDTTLELTFTNTLSAGQITTLDGVVADHKANA